MCCYNFYSKNTSGEEAILGGFGEQGITVVEQGKMYG